MTEQPTLFNYPETKRLNDLEKMITRLSKDYAVLKNEINNIKIDIEKAKKDEALRRINAG